jgi:phage terminase large subunit GpA-like protein
MKIAITDRPDSQPFLGLMQGLEPEPDITVTEHADAVRILPRKGSIEPGKYSSSRTPYMVEIMDCLSVNHECTELSLMKGTQLGATEVSTNFIVYIVDAAPGSILMVMPTDKLAEEHSKGKLTDSLEAIPAIKSKVFEKKTRSSTNTILVKDFPGGILFLSGANSPANYRNKSIRYLILDDFDGFPHVAGAEGDPGKLAEKRTDTYSIRKKIYRNSTPTIKGLSRIEKDYNLSDQRSYEVPCPFCGERQKLVWGGKGETFGIKFKRNNVNEVVDAWYECRACHEAIDESHKTDMLKKGKWVAKYPRRDKRGYHLSGLYSPLGWVSWLQIAQEFIDSKADPEALKVWTNTRLADVWDEKGSQPEWRLLKNRTEMYKQRQLSDPVVFLTAGVDVQANRLVAVVRGWAPGEESYLTYFTELYGNPLLNPVWQQLDMLLAYPFEHPTGKPLYIKQCAVDTGYLSNEVYNYCRLRPVQTMATKGASTFNLPIVNKPSWVDVNCDGETLKGEHGVQLWRIGTDTAKSLIYGRLALDKPGPGFYHFPENVDDEYFKQLTAEKKVTQFRNGFPHAVWVKLRPRNDALDCEALALAAALKEGMAFVNWDRAREVQLGSGPGRPQAQTAPRKKRTIKKRKKW